MSRVLVVEDEPAIRDLERAILKSAGYLVLTAANGVEAFEVLNENEAAVVVLDLQMPVMDGRSFFRTLSHWEHRPAVLIVSSAEAGKAQRELGAEGSLDKPFSPEDLLASVDRLNAEEELGQR